MVDMSVSIGSVRLSGPVMPASGTMAEQLANIIDLSLLPAVVLKTITPDIRQGTKPPRVAEFTDATLFSIGIPSKGPDYFLEHTIPYYKEYGVPIVASISADTAEEFGTLAAYISVPEVAAIEANISCPNLRADGRAFGMDLQATADVVREMKAKSPKPVWAKLTPNVGDIGSFAKAAEDAGADALVVGNAILGMAIDAEARAPKLGNVTGGLTGNAVKPILLRMVNQCAGVVNIPIIGCGGISTGEDAVEYLLAGATAVQMGTVNFVRPSAMLHALEWMEDYCRRHAIARVSELTGALDGGLETHLQLQEVL